MKFPPCGVYCKYCVVYKKKCEGCVETAGKPYYVKECGKGICQVWDCATKRAAEHCGLCPKFPCDKFLGWYSPRRGITPVLRRVGLLTLRKKIGTEAWIKWMENKKIEFGT